jgi:hypothetical protein
VALLEKRGFLYNHSGDFPQVILIVPSHVPNKNYGLLGVENKISQITMILSVHWCILRYFRI